MIRLDTVIEYIVYALQMQRTIITFLIRYDIYHYQNVITSHNYFLCHLLCTIKDDIAVTRGLLT